MVNNQVIEQQKCLCRICKKRFATQKAQMDQNENWDVCDFCKSIIEDSYWEAQMEAVQEMGYDEYNDNSW